MPCQDVTSIGYHGPEFPSFEAAAILTNSGMAEENRTL